MKVSVLVPVYNLERFIEPCLESLLTQQVNFDYEVIAIDDGSRDGSWAIMQQLATRYPQLRALQNPQNIGVCRTIRRLLELSRGEYLAYVDGDDLDMPGKLQTLANYVDENPTCGFVYHEAEVFYSENGPDVNKLSKPGLSEITQAIYMDYTWTLNPSTKKATPFFKVIPYNYYDFTKEACKQEFAYPTPAQLKKVSKDKGYKKWYVEMVGK